MIKQAVKIVGAQLTLIDPLPRSLNGGFADTWIRPVPGTQPALLAGLLREMLSIAASARARDVLGKTGISKVQAEVEPFTPEHVEELTGVPARLLRDTGRRLSSGKRLAIIPGAGIAREEGAVHSGALLAVMLLVSGDLAQKGHGLFPVALSLNDQGALDMGACPDRLPGHRDVADPGMDYISMIEAALSGTLKGLCVVGENPVRDCPSSRKVREALSGLELLLVQDLFLTETASLADVVLPSASFAEREGTFTNLERRVQRFRKAIEPAGESRPDGEILTDLMGRMGHAVSCTTPTEQLAEISEQIPAYKGITLRRLELEREGVFTPCHDEEDPGTPVLYAHTSPRAREDLAMGPLEGTASSTPEAFPLWLMTTPTVFHSADGVRTLRSRLLLDAAGEACVTMNPFDAGPLGIEEGDTAQVMSSQGTLRTRVATSERVPRGIVVATSMGEQSPEGLSSLEARDSEHGAPRTHRLAVRVEGEHGTS
jgi:formate dehydrogenase major subunit/formate dehydrogenase alpha subunit